MFASERDDFRIFLVSRAKFRSFSSIKGAVVPPFSSFSYIESDHFNFSPTDFINSIHTRNTPDHLLHTLSKETSAQRFNLLLTRGTMRLEDNKVND